LVGIAEKTRKVRDDSKALGTADQFLENGPVGRRSGGEAKGATKKRKSLAKKK